MPEEDGEEHVFHPVVEVLEGGLVHLVEGDGAGDVYPGFQRDAIDRVAVPGGYLDRFAELLYAIFEVFYRTFVLISPSAVYQGKVLFMELVISCQCYLTLVYLSRL